MTVSRLGSVIGRLIVWWPDRANATPGGELDRLDAVDVLFRRFHGAVDFGGGLAAVVRGAVAGVVGEVVIQRFQQIERGLQSVAYFGDVHGSLHLSCQLACVFIVLLVAAEPFLDRAEQLARGRHTDLRSPQMPPVSRLVVRL